jgi:dihydroorotase
MPDAQPYDLILSGGLVVTPAGCVETDIGVREERIVAIGSLSRQSAAQIIEAKGLHVLPGVIDSQVHFREPGLDYKEDLESGTRAAALGGVTAIFEMPNTNPATTTAAALADKCRRADGRAWVDYAFFIGASAENASELATLERAPGCAGVKIFMGSSTGSLLIPEDTLLENVLSHGQRRVAVHAEDEPRLIERKPLAIDAAHPRAHPIWRDEQTAYNATARLLSVARRTHRLVHVLHVTTGEEMGLLAGHKDIATVEVLPQHLVLSAPECYERLGTYAQMNPPIRGKNHQDALWEALRQGIVDVVASDHAPHTHEEKAKTYPASPSGMPGVQTLLPLMLQQVAAERLSLLHLTDLLSAAPARVLGAKRKGRIAVGYDADFTLVDLNAKRRISHQQMASKCGWTPYDGLWVQGWPIMTVVRGQLIMRDDTLFLPGKGKAVLFS